ncbi:TolC family protein [Chitinophaga pinensis]|uniref:TolC family protein n=1 Tax=Chitinophaga pinensis TaxID=79329 RepID=A0A5C6LNH6_9BACT|nr:TolC family protein [Chitinophaga pinensis]TWV98712.1 TolC family protein [Chitinophaga pinensis]
MILRSAWILLLSVGLSPLLAIAQQQNSISLPEMVSLSQTRSSLSKVAITQKEIRYYQFLTLRSDLKPQISLYGNLPSYSKQYTSVTQPDGKIAFLPVQQNYSNLGFSLSQEIPFSGGLLSLNSELSQFYDFKEKYREYNGTPVFLHLTQPVFGFNTLKWRKRIEPLLYEESKREYVQTMENIAQQTVRLYFDVLDAQVNIAIASGNLNNDSINYVLESRRIDLGTTSESKLMQLQLRHLRSRQDLDRARYDYKIAKLALEGYAGFHMDPDMTLQLPADIPAMTIPLEQAIVFARQYRPEYIAFERKKLEAERDVAQAKAEKQQINLVANFGLNRASTSLRPIYTDPKNQQTLSVGINMPLVDWGRRRNRYKTSVALEKLTNFNNNIDSVNLVQEIVTLVSSIELLNGNINLGKITDSIAERSFEMINSQFQTGKLTIVDLNLAQTERDNARRNYIDTLREYWDTYFRIRRLTFYDFEHMKSLYQAN